MRTIADLRNHWDRQWRWGELNVAHVACSYNAPEILAWALEQVPAMMAMEDPMGRLPLHWCAFVSVTNLVKLLLDASKAHDPALLQHQLDHNRHIDHLRSVQNIFKLIFLGLLLFFLTKV